MRDGVIADFEVAEEMIKHFIRKVHNRRSFANPMIIVCVPSGSRGGAPRHPGIGPVGRRPPGVLIEEPMAAAIGAGLPSPSRPARWLVDIGGGSTEVAVCCPWRHRLFPQRAGRRRQDGRGDHRLYPPPPEPADRRASAESHQEGIGTAAPPEDGHGVTQDIKGRDLLNGCPERDQHHPAPYRRGPGRTGRRHRRGGQGWKPPRRNWRPISSTRGIVLTGGGSLLANLDSVLREETGLPVSIADDPLSCVALGTGRVLENTKGMRHVLSTAF